MAESWDAFPDAGSGWDAFPDHDEKKDRTDIAGKVLANVPIVGPLYRAAVALDPSLAKTPGRMIANAPGDAADLAGGIANAVTNPKETGTALLNFVQGLGAKIALDPNSADAIAGRPHEPMVDAAWQSIKDNYGSYAGIKNRLETKPVSFAADVSTVAMPGTALAKAPGMVGQVGRGIANVGTAVDPINAALKAGEAVGKGAGYGVSSLLGRTSGVGGTVVRTAAEEGMKGGESARVFRENMRGADPEGMVGMADSALDQMGVAKSKAYNEGMTGVRGDPAVLDLKPIVNAYANSVEVGTFKGKTINRSAVRVQQEILEVLEDWAKSSPAEYHTPAGFDALKKTIGDIRESTQPRTPSRVVADRVYNVVKQQIEAQAPEYAKTMKAYEDAQRLGKQLRKTFSRTANASDETAVGKLLSTARNNVTSNYTQRRKMLDELAKYEPTLPAAIAGQTLSSYAPRGLTANLAGTGGLAAVAMNPSLLAAAPAFMPRVVGEAAHAAGRAARPFSKIDPAILRTTGLLGYQSDRLRGLLE